MKWQSDGPFILGHIRSILAYRVNRFGINSQIVTSMGGLTHTSDKVEDLS